MSDITLERIILQIVITIIFTVIPVAIFARREANKHHADKSKALKELADALGQTHDETHKYLMAIQQKIHESNTLAEVRQWMENEFLRMAKEHGIEPVLRLDWARARRNENRP